jgi:pyrophosphate--fructose-6-phosphate 1-phosphotransferase
MSFGFDTACKTYSATIGSLLRDALSAKKYFFFVKMMGRSASHVALECALQTHPNMTLISEEVAAKKTTLSEIVDQIATMIMERSKQGKEYGVVVIPEGVIEFVADLKLLIEELNSLLAAGSPHAAAIEAITDADKKVAAVTPLLSCMGQNCYEKLPRDTKLQLLLTRDPHGNVQVSKIETERMLIEMVEEALREKGFKGKFNPQPIFCGYEGRSCPPSNFDADYCYALGYVAVALIRAHKTGYVCTINGLADGVDAWKCGAVPLVSDPTTSCFGVVPLHESIDPSFRLRNAGRKYADMAATCHGLCAAQILPHQCQRDFLKRNDFRCRHNKHLAHGSHRNIHTDRSFLVFPQGTRIGPPSLHQEP